MNLLYKNSPNPLRQNSQTYFIRLCMPVYRGVVLMMLMICLQIQWDPHTGDRRGWETIHFGVSHA
jgi:hypothetical protein